MLPGNLLRWDGVIQPTLWESSLRGISICCYEAIPRIIFRDSIDWRYPPAARATSLPNNNASGIDVSMQDSTLILALNPVNGNWGALSAFTDCFP